MRAIDFLSVKERRRVESAIKAAMNPPEGDWLYFVTVNLTTGETKFAATEDEFWKLRDEYKNSNSNAN